MEFRDLFNYLRTEHNISENMAWSRAVKAKRGCNNNKNPGVFTKDLVYFRGHEELMEFLKNGGNISDLYVGKVTIADLPLLQKYQEIVPAKFILNQ